MAKKNDALATTDDADAIVVAEEFQDLVGKGLEGMTKDDLKMPRLALAQGLSPQLEETDPLYIEGLKLGDAFNSLTGEIYGKGPWPVAVIRRDKPRWVEFYPRDEGGGVKDLNVPPDDERCQWRTEDGERLPPIATQFYDYIICFLETREIIAVSFKSTGIRQTAHPWNSLMKLRGTKKPMCWGVYKLQSVMTKNAKGKFAAFRVDNAGWATEPELQSFLAEAFRSMQDKEVEIHRDGEPAEDTPF